MSNRKRKKKQIKKHQMKVYKKRTDLKSALQSIYHDTISLETSCCHSCTCCKVAMPQINYSEFINIASRIWGDKEFDKVELICKSVEYFFRNEYEKWGMDSLVKPCMFLDEDDRCKIYEERPLNCRLYGLWPEDIYNKRVEKFVKAYEPYGLSKEEIPLSTQCPNVKLTDESVELTEEVIESLFEQIDDVDKTIGEFSNLQIKQKENYRTFHDWLLLKVFQEDWLSMLTSFILAATRETMEDQIDQIKAVVRKKYADKLPDLEEVL